jgi:hypothetical protein
MPTATQQPKPLPNADTQWVDQQGRPTPLLYEYLRNMDELMRKLRLEIP